MLRRTALLLLAPFIAVGLVAVPSAAYADSYSAPLTAAVADLPVAHPSDLDIDHLVPLAEAWDSGARSWSTATRQAFANDLGDSRSLVGVTDNVNQAKGDQDPAEWLPTYSKCRYLREWVAVKHRWRLRVNSAEKSKLTSLASGCTNTTITVTLAR